jgi:uncharacterized protein with PQ loop repeat
MKKHIHTKNCTHVQHHQHVRKNRSKKSFKLTFVDRLVYVAGPMIPVAIVPQAYSVWVNGQTDGVALPTWIILSITSLSMASYAVVHREKPLIYTYIPLFFLNSSVVIGVLIKG